MRPGLLSTLESGIRDLYPGYFAMVMATGIVSLASDMVGMSWIASLLFIVNVGAYVVLWLLTGARLLRHFDCVWSDLTSHRRGPGFFTWIAGTCVLGVQFAIQSTRIQVASGLWFIALGLWVFVMYTFFTAVVVRRGKPSLQRGINGAWLIATVATQSVSILGALLARHLPIPLDQTLFFSLIMFLIGCMLYLAIITLIFYRFTFLHLSSEELTPPYWINMGAVAITTLAGASLMLTAQSWNLLWGMRPFLTGFTLFFWATATWWVPILFILGAWRHIFQRFPLRYTPLYWGMVFPLGMYTASTYRLAEALGVEFLKAVPRLFIYVALTAWLLTFAGLLLELFHAGLRALRHLRPSLWESSP